MNEIIILPAVSKEVTIIRELSLSHLSEEQKNKYFQVANARSKHFDNMISGKKGICLVAHVNQKVVGYVVGGPRVAGFTSIKYAELENVFVLPKYRNQGIATKLCTEFIDWTKSVGFERLSVITGWKNQKQLIPFYERLGFKPLTIELENHRLEI